MPKKDDSRNQRPEKKPSASSGDRSHNSSGKLDDVTFNVITVLHKKSEGLHAYEQYLEDAEGNEEIYQIFEELRDQDQEAVSKLQDCLRELIGKSSEGEEEEDVA